MSNKNKMCFNILDTFRTASPFSRVQINAQLFVLPTYMSIILLFTLEDELAVRNVSRILKHIVFHFGKPPSDTILDIIDRIMVICDTQIVYE